MEEKPLQEYVDSAQSVIEDSPQMQEATTKASLLNDFVELLGWEIPKNTELEYSVKAFGKTPVRSSTGASTSRCQTGRSDECSKRNENGY
jgi:hypothetical protein